MSDVMDELLDPLFTSFTPALAQQIAGLQASPRVEALIDDLAQKCRAGQLSESERAEYETYVDAVDLISILQAKARGFLDASHD